MIGCCGLDCDKCDAFIATARDDDGMRATVAKKWAETYGAPIVAGDINCTGCRSNGVKFSYCEHMCEIRKCAMGRGLSTCAECADYSCDTLEGVLGRVPQAREALDALRRK